MIKKFGLWFRRFSVILLIFVVILTKMSLCTIRLSSARLCSTMFDFFYNIFEIFEWRPLAPSGALWRPLAPYGQNIFSNGALSAPLGKNICTAFFRIFSTNILAQGRQRAPKGRLILPRGAKGRQRAPKGAIGRHRKNLENFENS